MSLPLDAPIDDSADILRPRSMQYLEVVLLLYFLGA